MIANFPTVLKFLAVGVVALPLTGCLTNGGGNKQLAGGLAGGVAGGAIGSTVGSGGNRVLATAAGATIGFLIGSEIGRSLDEQDQQRAFAAAQNSFATGRTTRWTNKQTGHYGTVDPTPSFTSQTGQNCRKFSHTMWVKGENEAVDGTACQQQDGTWNIVS